MDPRPAVIARRLAGIERVVAVTGGKGGIGKSLVSSTLALCMARRGLRVGLFDLDLTGPCDHLILGIDTGFPEEPFGIEPPLVHGIRFMSVTCFARDDPAPLRGKEISDALIELLAITRWGELDLLVVDMPPGLGDVTLDTVRFIDGAGFLVVATPSRVVVETVQRTLGLLERTQSRVLGVIENMRREESDAVADLARRARVPMLGSLPYDPTVEAAIGDPERLAATPFARALDKKGDRFILR